VAIGLGMFSMGQMTGEPRAWPALMHWAPWVCVLAFGQRRAAPEVRPTNPTLDNHSHLTPGLLLLWLSMESHSTGLC
jgi:hypothetical protein